MKDAVSEVLAEKTHLERSRDILLQIKEMQHYSISNIKKLSGFYLFISV